MSGQSTPPAPPVEEPPVTPPPTQGGAEAAANNNGKNYQPQVSVSQLSSKIFSSLSSIKQRLFACFSYIFNRHLSSTSLHNDNKRPFLHVTITQPTTYNCENDLSLLLGEDYEDIIGNAIADIQRRPNTTTADNTTYDYSLPDDLLDNDSPICFTLSNDHQSMILILSIDRHYLCRHRHCQQNKMVSTHRPSVGSGKAVLYGLQNEHRRSKYRDGRLRGPQKRLLSHKQGVIHATTATMTKKREKKK